MKLYSSYVDVKLFEKEFDDLKHIDFSLFFEYRPTHEELKQSSINIYGLEEPNEYTGNHDWAIENKHNFSLILTWSDRMLRECDNAILSPFGNSWLATDGMDLIEKPRTKNFEVSYLRGNLLKTCGHVLRHQIYPREKEIKIPTKFFKTTEPRDTFKDYIDGKELVLGNSMFSIIIENTSHNNYFTEKIVDCMLLKTIPIYWGCSNIEKYFDMESIIQFRSDDDVIDKINTLTPEYYYSRLKHIENNYNNALKYKNHIITIKNQLIEIFKHNNIL